METFYNVLYLLKNMLWYFLKFSKFSQLVTERTYDNNLSGWLWFCNVILSLSLSLSDVMSPLSSIGGKKKREVDPQNAMTAF